MVILQRWEPTIPPSFPSLIPFWIKVQGLPLHLWTEGTIRSIGNDIGIFEKAKITNLSARMRVHVNGLQPLIVKSVVEYPNGDEVITNLVYERLEKHCSKCLRLDHEVKECLEAKHEARALKATQEEMASRSSHGTNQEVIREVKHHAMNTSRPAGQKSRDSYHEISSRHTHARGNTAQLRHNEDRRYDYSNPSNRASRERRRDNREGKTYPARHHPYRRSGHQAFPSQTQRYREVRRYKPTNHKAAEGEELYDNDNSRGIPTERREGYRKESSSSRALRNPPARTPSIKLGALEVP